MSLGLVFGYVGLLLIAGLTSPGVGVLGNVLVILPTDLLDWLHIPSFGLLTWVAVRGLQDRNWPFPYALSTGMIAALVFGLWIEVLQGSVEGRVTSFDDLLIDAVGIGLVGAILARRIVWRCPPQQAALSIPAAS